MDRMHHKWRHLPGMDCVPHAGMGCLLAADLHPAGSRGCMQSWHTRST